jgi:hypothetical protein
VSLPFDLPSAPPLAPDLLRQASLVGVGLELARRCVLVCEFVEAAKDVGLASACLLEVAASAATANAFAEMASRLSGAVRCLLVQHHADVAQDCRRLSQKASADASLAVARLNAVKQSIGGVGHA